jgi:hypothetical protein
MADGGRAAANVKTSVRIERVLNPVTGQLENLAVLPNPINVPIRESEAIVIPSRRIRVKNFAMQREFPARCSACRQCILDSRELQGKFTNAELGLSGGKRSTRKQKKSKHRKTYRKRR